jgi:uncharacterized protein (TIGR02145 family)
MKNFYFTAKILLFSLAFFSLQATAQAPQKMSYQSVLRNSSNVLLASKQVGIKISVLQGGALGNAVYTETQTPTTNANGLVSIQIGTGANQTGTFAGINWATGSYFIKTETDPEGGTNYSITGTQEILSVPYAMYAAKSANDAAQTAAITAMQAQITALQAQVTPLLYPTVTIGSQVWTSTNLNVTTYRNGDAIPEVQDGAAWANLTTGAWCHLNNDPANDAIYGKLYNWYAVNDARGLAPQGWHIPTDVEWSTLGTFLGGDGVAGGKMKTTGTTRWTTPNTGATNESGFAGLPGGYRIFGGRFYDVGFGGSWWSATQAQTFQTDAKFRGLGYINGDLFRLESDKKDGLSVRYLRD